MHGLKVKLNHNQTVEIAREFDRLCAFTSKRVSVNDREYFVQELASGDFAFAAVIKGLQSLHEADLKDITLRGIKEAIKKHISWVFENPRQDHCVACNNTGMVSLSDDKQRSFTFACKCQIGSAWGSAVKAPVWNGQYTQIHKGSAMQLHPSIIMDLELAKKNNGMQAK